MDFKDNKVICVCFVFCSLVLILAGCMPAIERANGKKAHYVAPDQKSDMSGVGIDSRDIIIMTNDTLLEMEETTEGLKESGSLIINTTKNREALEPFCSSHIYPVNATALAHELFGRPIVNTILFGALLGVTDLFPLDAAAEIVTGQFAGRNSDLNRQALLRGYEGIRKVI